MPYLAGKFFTSLSPPSIKTTKSSLLQQWSSYISIYFDVSLSDKNLISVDFEKEEDINFILTKGPWNVDGCILILKEHLLTDIYYNLACFWVKVEGLPLSHYTEAYANKVANRLSHKPPIQKKIDRLKREFWLRVELDLRQPLKAGFFTNKKQLKPHYVLFKYMNLGNFCMVCGRIDHTHCEESPKYRDLTCNVRVKTYGPWLRYSQTLKVSHLPLSAAFKFDFSETPTKEEEEEEEKEKEKEKEEKEEEEKEKEKEEKEEEEEEVEAELLVDFRFDVVYRSEHEWLGKYLSRSFLHKYEKNRFRLPLSSLAKFHEVLQGEIEEMAPLVDLRMREQAYVISKFVDYLIENRKKWSRRRARWVLIRASATKQITIPIVECERMIQDRRDEERHAKINRVITEVIKTRVETNANLMLLFEWEESIDNALRAFGVFLVYSELLTRAVEAREQAVEMELSRYRSPKPADRRRVEELKTTKMLGHEMTTCIICSDEMFIGDKAIRMPCSHLFHEECLQNWLKTGDSCPLCRFQLL